ncbi:MAG: hypothetical protein JW825_05990 [Candidatus Methanofastidiosa archaeon]|nr:hypothetical protein [Candidatus Methanofastidiosa archaeon]
MRRYMIGIALALIVLSSAMQVAGATYEHYIVWDEQERTVYAGNQAEFNLSIVTTALGPPASTPAPTSPPTTWPTPPPPPEDASLLTGPTCMLPSSIGGGALSSLNLVDVNTVYLSTLAPTGWETELSADTLYLEGEDSGDVLVQVRAPGDATPGVYSILFTARMHGIDKNVELLVRVLDPFDVIISNISFTPLEPKLGDVVTFTADLTLSGNVIIPTKTVALYINQIAQTKLASTQVELGPNSTETVTLTWTASQIGDLTARMYVNPTNSESSLTNNEVSTAITILPAEDPCSLADDTYSLALDMYNEDCESAITTLQVARALYEQCGDDVGVTACEDLIEKCEQYTLAEELEGQGDILAANGDCEGAIAKWEAAKAIYQQYNDLAMIGALNSKIANCEVEPLPSDDEGFFGKYWKWLLLLLIALILFLILLFSRRRKDEEEDTTFGIYPSGETEARRPSRPLFGEVEEGLEITPIIPLPVVSKEDEDDISKFMSDLEKTLEAYQPAVIAGDIKGAVNRYSSMIDRRNALLQKMDDTARRHVDRLIKEFEDRVFEAL